MPNHEANYDRQDRGFELLQKELPGFYAPTVTEKKKILEILGISQRFKATFDAIRLKVPAFADVQNARDFDLLELKVTDKHLPHLPQGFFFGMTDNEEMLLKVFEGKYFLCLVCMNPKSRGYALVDWAQLRELTQNRRIQYQINLVGKSKSARAAN